MKKALLYVLLIVCLLCMSGCVQMNSPEDGYDVSGTLNVSMDPANETLTSADSIILSGKVHIHVFEQLDLDDPVLEINAEDMSATITGTDPITIDVDIPYEGLAYSTDYYLDMAELSITVMAGDELLKTYSSPTFANDTATFTTIDQPPELPPEEEPPEEDPPQEELPEEDPPQEELPEEDPPENISPGEDQPEDDLPEDILLEEMPSEEDQPGEEYLGGGEAIPEESIPATGDESGIALWLVLAAASLMGLLVILRSRKRA